VNIVTLLRPPRIVFGNGCAAQCAELFAQRRLGRVLLVTSTPVRPILVSLLEALSRAGVEVVESPPVDAEPTIAMFEAALQVARAENVEAVLGVGGGSPMDVAKLVAAIAHGRQTAREVFGINLLQSRELYLVCLPTTAGTGSEVTPNSILLDEVEKLKKGIVSPHLVPDAAYVDPLLTLTVPPPVTAATGLDALTHCLEAFANKFAHPAVDLYALNGVRLVSTHLLRAVRNGTDTEARANLALGSLFGGLCLGPVNTGAVHALAYPLGGEFHVAHGVSNALLLPHVLRFNLPAAPERYAEIALALGVERAGSEQATAERGLERLAQLSQESGVPQKLSEVGVPREAIPRMAKSAMTVTRLLKNNLRPVTETDAVNIYEAAF
jgi:alcohol dehydrogenase class IV